MKIRELAQNRSIVGTSQTVRGWLRTIRLQKNVAFLQVNDGSTLAGLQVIADPNDPSMAIVLNQLTTGSSVEINGLIDLSPDQSNKEQNVELKATAIKLLGECDANSYPLQKKRHSLEFLREIAHLRPRSNTIGAVSRLRHALSMAVHQFFNDLGFCYIHTPIITASDCEGAGQMFRVTTLNNEQLAVKPQPIEEDFFGKTAYLTVSGQLNGEIYASALGDVYTFGPTFRAENSNTSRHLAEFWMIEPEMAFADLTDTIQRAHELLKHCVKYAIDHCPEEMKFFDSFIKPGLLVSLKKFLNDSLQVITYTQAVEILKASSKNFQYAVEWGADLQSEHERYLCEEHFQSPVVVTNYPKEIKSFYMRENEDKKTVAAMDFLVPQIGEIIGGSQREERYDKLLARLHELGLKEEDYWWYLELRKYGSVIHSGFGLGFERLIQWISGLENIRDVIAFPRYPKHADF
jgi:asparaginyl-tRNA synthetase